MQTFGNAVPSYTIIDGQQRLTTFQIFLGAFRDLARLHNTERFAAEIERYIFNTGLMENQEIEQFKVFPTRADQEQFRDVMTAGSQLQLEEKYPAVYVRRKLQERPRIVEAYLYFTDAIDEYLKEHSTALPAHVALDANTVAEHDLEERAGSEAGKVGEEVNVNQQLTDGRSEPTPQESIVSNPLTPSKVESLDEKAPREYALQGYKRLNREKASCP